MKTKRNSDPNRFSWGHFWAGTLFLAVAFFLYNAVEWYADTYGLIGFDAILYTLTADLGGVDSNLIVSFVKSAVPDTIMTTAICSFFLYFRCDRKLVLALRSKRSVRLYPFTRKVSAILAAVIGVTALAAAAEKSELTKFIYYIGNPSTLYEEEYYDPAETEVTFPEEKRNLIYIYLESMETSFFSEEEEGALGYDVIPELRQLAEENINFSQNAQVGGFEAAPGATWTIGALVGQTAGIPMKTPLGVDKNEYGSDGNFLPGITGLTDILADNGYYQAAMFGSDASFGGRLQYYRGHGVDKVYDLYSAMEDGIVEDGYHNGFWGMEDLYLYEYAKQALTEMAAGEEPFAFTLLTVDTHHVDGYICELCGSDYVQQYENVFRCASKQLVEFVAWLQQQTFYENTTVIIAGDHPSMDGAYAARNFGSYERKVYNCFINAAAETENTKNRQFSTFDMFPSTLAAMGCTIKGDRLGLGTNLFSDQPTLVETMGLEKFKEEVSRYSDYYIRNFF